MAPILIPVASATDVTPDAAGMMTPTDPAGGQMEEAVRFRTEFGLDADVAWIAQVDESLSADTTHAVSLSPDEAKLMGRRGEIRAALLPALKAGQAQPAGFGGMWITYPVGGTLSDAMTVNVGVKDSPDLGSELTKLIPDGATVAIHQSRYSEAELNALHPKVAGDGAFFESVGTQFQSVDTIVADNVDEIAVAPLTSEIERAIVDRYGDEVRVVFGGGVGGDTCTRANCGPPWKGGGQMIRGVNGCTMGPVVAKKPGTTWLFAVATAGHCGAGTWHEGGSTSGTTIGTSTSANVWFTTQTSTDFQIIPISAANADFRIIIGTASCTACPLHGIFAQQDLNTDLVGDEVCNEGYVTGHTCGTLRSTSYTFNWTAEGKTFFNFRRATYTRHLGDSGGPVWAMASGYAAGTHTHYTTISGVNYPVYPHIYWSTVYSGYSICYPQC